MNKAGVLFLPLLALVQSCINVDIVRDPDRPASPKEFVLTEHIKLSSTGTVLINDGLFLPASVRIDTHDLVVYIDPLHVDDPVPADIILLTHGHPDHCSLMDIDKLTGPETRIIGPKSVVKKLRTYSVHEVQPGNRIGIAGISIEAVAAYNTRNVFLLMKAHPRSKKNVGYVIGFGEYRLYHAGDTDFIPEMQELPPIDLALIPIGGDNLTMAPVDAAYGVNAFRPASVLPIHFDPRMVYKLEEFRAIITEGTKVLTLGEE